MRDPSILVHLCLNGICFDLSYVGKHVILNERSESSISRFLLIYWIKQKLIGLSGYFEMRIRSEFMIMLYLSNVRPFQLNGSDHRRTRVSDRVLLALD